ncbi:MAG: hypothetical protein MUE31_13425 [Candidatus Nanopelagicales bacterium]|jgi:hypothetical protein|nr:hypothetical protein [Candidatus Nanopelagicales bacterium]
MLDNLSRFRPSPALVVSFAAITLLAGGTAMAAPDAPDSGLQALTKAKVRKIATNQANKAITDRAPTLEVLLAQTVADNAISTAKIADGAVTSAKLAEDAVKAREFGPTQVATNGAGIANTTTATVAVTCPAGTQMISGGGTATLGGNDNIFMVRSAPSGNGWAVTYRNLSGAALTITAVATCLSA